MQVPYFCQRMEETKMSIIISTDKENVTIQWTYSFKLEGDGNRHYQELDFEDIMLNKRSQ